MPELLAHCPLYKYLEYNPKQISTLNGLKPCVYKTVRLARDFYRMVDEGKDILTFFLNIILNVSI